MDETSFAFLLPPVVHIIFVILALIILIYNYRKEKKTYQLIFIIAVPITLLLELTRFMNLKNARSLYYSVGAFEIILIIGALVFTLLQSLGKKKDKENIELDKTYEEAIENQGDEKNDG